MTTNSCFSDSTAAGTTRCVADALGLGSLADDEIGIDPARFQALYRHARNEQGRRQLYANDPSFVRGWVRLDEPVAAALIAPLVPLDDEADLKKARRIAANNLEAQPWNDLLGIDDPPIRCRVKLHGTKFALRFESPGLKGKEPVNEALPPIPADKLLQLPSEDDPDLPGPVPPTTSSPVTTTEAAATSPAASQSPSDILKNAGLPS